MNSDEKIYVVRADFGFGSEELSDVSSYISEFLISIDLDDPRDSNLVVGKFSNPYGSSEYFTREPLTIQKLIYLIGENNTGNYEQMYKEPSQALWI
jgi:hypothetical protein